MVSFSGQRPTHQQKCPPRAIHVQSYVLARILGHVVAYVEIGKITLHFLLNLINVTSQVGWQKETHRNFAQIWRVHLGCKEIPQQLLSTLYLLFGSNEAHVPTIVHCAKYRMLNLFVLARLILITIAVEGGGGTIRILISQTNPNFTRIHLDLDLLDVQQNKFAFLLAKRKCLNLQLF